MLDWNQPSIDFYRSVGAEETEGTATYRLAGGALAELADQHV